MTINIAATTNTSVLAYHHTQNGEPGYNLHVGPQTVFITEKDADALARYFLFKEEGTDGES